MLVTPLVFSQVLERFYKQHQYEYMLLFVSSFDGKDRDIIQGIVDNAKRIDRITGDRICFFYFIENRHDWMNDSLIRWVKRIPDYRSLYGEGVDVNFVMGGIGAVVYRAFLNGDGGQQRVVVV